MAFRMRAIFIRSWPTMAVKGKIEGIGLINSLFVV
jgi:hypothetical protein